MTWINTYAAHQVLWRTPAVLTAQEAETREVDEYRDQGQLEQCSEILSLNTKYINKKTKVKPQSLLTKVAVLSSKSYLEIQRLFIDKIIFPV